MKQKLIIIQGPTGVGKTDIALSLAEKLPVELINADSMQVYRYMDIGTSKPDSRAQRAVPHHLLSIVNPDEPFDAAQFMMRGRQAIAQIVSRGNHPVVVGGTGLYIKSLTRGLFSGPAKDEKLRETLGRMETGRLYKKLEQIDPDAARRINDGDSVRIIRALEVFYLTGETMSQHQHKHSFQDMPYTCLRLCLTREREDLYRRIEKRVDQMIQQGFIREVRKLLEMGYAPQLKSLGSIGYKQIAAYLYGTLSLEDAVFQTKRDTKRFAKRQFTWLRREPEVVWIALPEKADEVCERVKNFLNIA